MELTDIIQILNSGGQVALIVCVYFLMKCTERLARIEKALQKYMDEHEQ